MPLASNGIRKLISIDDLPRAWRSLIDDFEQRTDLLDPAQLRRRRVVGRRGAWQAHPGGCLFSTPTAEGGHGRLCCRLAFERVRHHRCELFYDAEAVAAARLDAG